MTPPHEPRIKAFLDWLVNQQGPITHDRLLAAGETICRIPREPLSQIITMLTTHDCLVQGTDRDNMPRYSTNKQTIVNIQPDLLQQLIRICSNHGPPPKGPGAPPGNTNALKHGRYSQRIQTLLQLPTDLSIASEIAIVQAIVEELVEKENTPVELILKAVTTLARLKLHAATRVTQPPTDPTQHPHPYPTEEP